MQDGLLLLAIAEEVAEAATAAAEEVSATASPFDSSLLSERCLLRDRSSSGESRSLWDRSETDVALAGVGCAETAAWQLEFHEDASKRGRLEEDEREPTESEI